MTTHLKLEERPKSPILASRLATSTGSSDPEAREHDAAHQAPLLDFVAVVTLMTTVATLQRDVLELQRKVKELQHMQSA